VSVGSAAGLLGVGAGLFGAVLIVLADTVAELFLPESIIQP
jgi:ABC-type Fe3+-siderophore transport system permease subunit